MSTREQVAVHSAPSRVLAGSGNAFGKLNGQTSSQYGVAQCGQKSGAVSEMGARKHHWHQRENIEAGPACRSRGRDEATRCVEGRQTNPRPSRCRPHPGGDRQKDKAEHEHTWHEVSRGGGKTVFLN